MIYTLKQLINHMFMFNQIYFIFYICLLSFDLLVVLAVNTHEQSQEIQFKVEKQRKEGDAVMLGIPEGYVGYQKLFSM